MSATCFDVVPKCKSCGLKMWKWNYNFTYLNRRDRHLIWTHSFIQSCAYPRKAKGEEEEGRKRQRPTLWSLVFLFFCLRACYLSLGILYSLVLGWLSILRKFSLLDFLPHEGFPGYIVVSVIVTLSVIFVLIVYQEYCKHILNLSKHT